MTTLHIDRGFAWMALLGVLVAMDATAAPAVTKPTAKTSAAVAPRTVPSTAPKLVPTLRTIAIPAAQKPSLAGKRLYDPARLASALTYVGAIPRLTVKPGRVVNLEPVTAEPTVPVGAITALAPALVQKLDRFKSRLKVINFGKPLLTATVVDHTAKQTPIRDQGGRGTCVAHAAVAALEALYKRAGVTRNLSENHAYNVFMSAEGSSCMADPGLQTWKAAGYLTSNRICEEAESPYVNSTGNSCQTIPAACAANRTHGYVTTNVFFAPAYGGTGTSIATNTAFLESLIDLDYDIVMGFFVAGSDWSDGTAATGAIDVQVDAQGNPAGAYGGHAMLIVGYNQTAGHFIVKNSWGTDVGHAGYYHLTYEYVQTYAKYGYVVTASI